MAFPLNDEQARAAAALRGPVLIRAGAGTGKTRTLTERFVSAMEDREPDGWSAIGVDQALTITFTDKAAGEIAERVRATLRARGRTVDARRLDNAWIGTIHGVCSRLLRRHALEAGLDPAFAVADAAESARLQEAAFLEVARAAMEDPAGERLFGWFEIDAVFQAVRSVDDLMRTNGCSEIHIGAESHPSAARLRADARNLFEEAGQSIAACGDASVSAERHAATCASVVCELEALDLDGLTEPDAALHIWRILEPWGPGSTSRAIKDTVEHIKEHQARILGEAVACAASPIARAFARLVGEYGTRYRHMKSAIGVLDFDDLQIETERLFAVRPDVAARYRSDFRLAMVDEFQDTDALQTRLISAVSGDELCTVGDERQSIYRFRGADVAVYRDQNERMLRAGAREFDLVWNYRSDERILAFVNRLFGSPEFFEGMPALKCGRTGESLLSPGEPAVDVTLVHRVQRPDGPAVDTVAIEAQAVAERFAELRDKHGVEPGAMVVLVRAYTHASAFADALEQRGFQSILVGGSRFFSATEVAVARALLRVVANPADDEALLVLLASPYSRVSDDALWSLRHAGSDRVDVTLWDALQAPAMPLAEADAVAVELLRRAIERARTSVGRQPLSETLLRAIEGCDIDLALLAGGEHGRQGYANLLKLARLADAFEASGGAGPASFEAHLASREQLGDHISPATLADEQTPAVRIMSIHAAKGLEFPVVAVPGLGDSARGDSSIVRCRIRDGRAVLAMRLPSEWSSASRPGSNRSPLFREIDEADKAEDAEEKKRLLYVACTRAEDALVLTGTANLDKTLEPGAGGLLGMARRALDPALEIGQAGERVVECGGAEVRVRRIDADSWSPSSNAPKPSARAGARPATSAAALGTPTPAPKPALSREEHAARPARVSYSDLGLFERCALRYRAERVLGVGSLGEKDSLHFGSAFHAVMQAAGPNGDPPSAERIAAIERAHGLSAQEAEKLGRALEAYAGSAVAGRLAGFGRVAREWPFALQLGEADDAFLLVGSVDAFGRTGARGLVVDYKSGTSGKPDELEERYGLQARCYALVALAAGCDDVEAVFVRPEVVGSDGELQTIGFAFTGADRPAIEAEISGRRDAIAGSAFEPLKAWDPVACSGCPIAGGACPVSPPRARR